MLFTFYMNHPRFENLKKLHMIHNYKTFIKLMILSLVLFPFISKAQVATVPRFQGTWNDVVKSDKFDAIDDQQALSALD